MITQFSYSPEAIKSLHESGSRNCQCRFHKWRRKLKRRFRGGGHLSRSFSVTCFDHFCSWNCWIVKFIDEQLYNRSASINDVLTMRKSGKSWQDKERVYRSRWIQNPQLHSKTFTKASQQSRQTFWTKLKRRSRSKFRNFSSQIHVTFFFLFFFSWVCRATEHQSLHWSIVKRKNHRLPKASNKKSFKPSTRFCSLKRKFRSTFSENIFPPTPILNLLIVSNKSLQRTTNCNPLFNIFIV